MWDCQGLSSFAAYISVLFTLEVAIGWGTGAQISLSHIPRLFPLLLPSSKKIVIISWIPQIYGFFNREFSVTFFVFIWKDTWHIWYSSLPFWDKRWNLKRKERPLRPLCSYRISFKRKPFEFCFFHGIATKYTKFKVCFYLLLFGGASWTTGS